MAGRVLGHMPFLDILEKQHMAKCNAFRDVLMELYKEFPMRHDEERFDRHNATICALQGDFDRATFLASSAGVPVDRIIALRALIQ